MNRIRKLLFCAAFHFFEAVHFAFVHRGELRRLVM